MKEYIRSAVERTDFLFPYALSFIVPGLLFFITVFLDSRGIVVDKYLLFLLAIPLVAWYGGFKPTLLAAVFSLLLLLFPMIHSFTAVHLSIILDSAVFFIAADLIGFIVERYKQTDRETIFKQKEREYKKMIKDLTIERESLQKDVKARDEFLSIASHELKTPLTSMLLQVQMVLHNIRNVSLAEFSVQGLLEKLDGAEHQIIRLSKMINDLLNVSLITTGRLDLELEEVDLSEVTKTVVNHFSDKLEKIGIVLDADKPVIGTWDRLRLEQVLTNLISNAIKYGDEKPIEVTVTTANSHGSVIVKDNGIGIPKEHQKRVFGRFERAVTDPNYKGLGVGLYISNQIIKAHHGHLKVKSKEGRGSEFTLELPLKSS